MSKPTLRSKFFPETETEAERPFLPHFETINLILAEADAEADVEVRIQFLFWLRRKLKA